MYRNWIIGIALVILLIIAALFMSSHSAAPNASIPGNNAVQVVAAENFWGSIVSQIGGSHVQVLSIVSDPNADPHEYASNTRDARAVSTANYVIENGVGYDSWMDRLLNAGGNPNRKILNVGTLVGKKEGDNPHLWYNPAYVNQAAAQMEQDLIALDPADTADFEANYQTLEANLSVYQNRIAAIKQRYAGTKVAATEDIFTYLADAAGLDLISPPPFMQAVAEGNDPPAADVVEFENQLKTKEPAVLVYNEQTATPLVENIKAIASQEGIPVIGITETIQPPSATYQDWMDAEISNLQNALGAVAPRQ